jgi:ribosome recycling factor
MDNLVNELKQKLTAAQDHTRGELTSIRTGKASPALVENIVVNTYGGTTKLRIQELAGVSVTGPNRLTINPYDVSTVQDIEKAIHTSPLHLTPRVDGKTIHIEIPPLSEEQRKDFVKLVSAKIEEGKIRIRGARDEARRHVKLLLESKEITEDDKFRIEKDVDKATHEATELLEEMKAKKEKEIMEV